MILPDPIQNLITAFERLPGIGPKSASRLAFFLLRAPDDIARSLAEALVVFKEQTSFCPECFNIMLASGERCEICASQVRDETIICVVEEPLDVIAIERRFRERLDAAVVEPRVQPDAGEVGFAVGRSRRRRLEVDRAVRFTREIPIRIGPPLGSRR